MPTTAPGPRSTRTPATFRPSTRTSLGHLIPARRPGPPATTPAVRLLVGEDDQPVVLPGSGRPRRQIVGAAHAAPDRDPAADPDRAQVVLDLVGTEPLRRAAIGHAARGVMLEDEP